MAPPASGAVSRPTAAIRTLLLTLSFAVALPAVARATLDLACTPGSLDFGKVVVGQNKTLPATLTNNGSAAVKLKSLKVENQAFAASGLSFPLVLKAGERVGFSVVFSPTSASPEPGALVFETASDSLLPVPAYGWGVHNWSLAASPSSLAFGNVAIGSHSTLAVTLTNEGSSTITISQETPPSRDFALSGPALPVYLEAGQGATFQVTFTPKWRGELATYFSVSNVGDPALTVPLSGTGGGTAAAQLTVAPATLSFGSVTVGNTGTKPATITAAGGSVTISAATLGSSLFSLSGITLPLTLSAGQSASFDVLFTPQSGGTVTSTLNFASTAADSPTAEALGGKGVEPAYTVNLSWDASTSQVSGYNVYRSPSLSGTYSKMNPELDASTAFTDNSVSSGSTYYYDVTSVNSSGVESSPCTPLKVTVN
ncbi:MAG: choice-of-anchor D domain-containing protein [Candidatus Sulfotelmatobacter sp.]